MNRRLVNRQKKSSRAHAAAEQALERERVKDLLMRSDDDTKKGSPSGSARNSPAPGGSNDRKTDAEKRFEAIKRERVSTSCVCVRIMLISAHF